MSPAGSALAALDALDRALARGVRVTDAHCDYAPGGSPAYACTIVARTASGRLTETGRGGTLAEAVRQVLGRLTVHEAALACAHADETPLGEAATVLP